MKNTETLKHSAKMLITVFAFIAVAMLAFGVVGCGSSNTEVITSSTLKDIVNIEELSTYESIYNGVAEIHNEKKPEKIDYYVSYDAKVKAGIDLDEVKIESDTNSKKIIVTIPRVKITGYSLDEGTLEFIDAEPSNSGVYKTALDASYDDVKQESQNIDALFENAQQNAENTITALLLPFVENMGDSYKLEVRTAE